MNWSNIHDNFQLTHRRDENQLKVFHPIVACLFMFIICQKVKEVEGFKGLKANSLQPMPKRFAPSFFRSIVPSFLGSSILDQNKRCWWFL